MKEVPFKLEIDADGWPPFPTEWLWLEENSDTHIVKNAPLFISGLAVGDELEISERDPSGEVISWKLVSPSDRSLVWIADHGGGRLNEILSSFRSLGCNTELLRAFSLAAIDIPPDVSKADVDAILDPIEGEKYAIAFPVDRQK